MVWWMFLVIVVVIAILVGLWLLLCWAMGLAEVSSAIEHEQRYPYD